MVLEFLRGGSSEGDFDHIVSKSVAMLGEARHSFDLASLALLTDTAPADVADDIRVTDERINDAEHELRSELVVHVSVRGSADIGSVLGFTLLLKKIERIGDQAKNILELAETGGDLANRPETPELLENRTAISALFADAAELLGNADVEDSEVITFGQRAHAMTTDLQHRIDDLMTTDRPGREVVPLAIYYRYLRRIVANLYGVVRSAAEPITASDTNVDGTDDTED